jgi:hypothetical protein
VQLTQQPNSKRRAASPQEGGVAAARTPRKGWALRMGRMRTSHRAVGDVGDGRRPAGADAGTAHGVVQSAGDHMQHAPSPTITISYHAFPHRPSFVERYPPSRSHNNINATGKTRPNLSRAHSFTGGIVCLTQPHPTPPHPFPRYFTRAHTPASALLVRSWPPHTHIRRVLPCGYPGAGQSWLRPRVAG